MGNAIEFQSQRIDEMENKMAAMDTKYVQLSDKISELEELVSAKDTDINKLERMSRRNNVRIVGIPVSVNENCEDTCTCIEPGPILGP